MTKYQRTGSKLIRKDTYRNPPDDDIITDRNVWVIVDGKHKPVFHRDGYMMIFYFKRAASEFLNSGNIPEGWRAMKSNLVITHV